MGIWGWNELAHNGSSLLSASGFISQAKPPEYSGNGDFNDSDWNFHLLPDAGDAWILTDPNDASHTNASGMIECEFEPPRFLDFGSTVPGRDQGSFDRCIAPMSNWRAFVSGYWARDRSHPFDNETASIGLLDDGGRGKMEIHPLVSILAVGPEVVTSQGWDQEFRWLAVCDGSDWEDERRKILEAAIDTPTSGGTHVPHRDTSQTVHVDYVGTHGNFVHLVKLDELDNSVDHSMHRVGAPPDYKGISFDVTTGRVSDGRGFYYYHGRMSFRT